MSLHLRISGSPRNRSQGISFPVLVALLGLLLISRLASPPQASAYTPESPEVKEMIARGVDLLGRLRDDRLGGRCLVSLALYKSDVPKEHAKIAGTVAECRELLERPAKELGEDIYSTGIAVIFLCEIDAEANADVILHLLESLRLRQKTHGGWGYPLNDEVHGPTGDTSMTQYAVLAHWEAKRHGLSITDGAVRDVCNWLLRTQDPDGNWGYQGKDPGRGNFERVQQNPEASLSLAAAGLGSVYMSADLLGLIERTAPKKAETGRPAALRVVEEEEAKAGGADRQVSRRMLERALRDGNKWFQEHYRIDAPEWTVYYMYALERYQSFREWAEGTSEAEPTWYNEGVELLKERQQQDGSWSFSSGRAVDTAFAILFLQRSMRKTIAKVSRDFGDGALVGGRGLPGNTSSIRLRRGSIVSTPISKPADELLSVLEEDHEGALAGLSAEAIELELSNDADTRARQTEQLRRLIAGRAPAARLIAVKALSQTRDLDNVPALLQALGDPDPAVVRAARDGLRLVSRRFDGFGLRDDPTPEQLRDAREAWRNWYQSVRPAAVLRDLNE